MRPTKNHLSRRCMIYFIIQCKIKGQGYGKNSLWGISPGWSEKNNSFLFLLVDAKRLVSHCLAAIGAKGFDLKYPDPTILNGIVLM